MKKYIAHQGEHFTIEWYYDNKGKSSAREYFEELSYDQKDKLAHLFFVMGATGQIRNEQKFTSEGDKIYAFKPAPERFLCFFFDGKKIIVTNAYRKQKDKMPPKEKHKALRSKDDYTKRCKAGTYYE